MLYIFSIIVVADVKFDDDNIQWLENNNKPWIKVKELWEVTSQNRLQLLKKNTIAIHDYMDSFSALKSESGYLLVCKFILTNN